MLHLNSSLIDTGWMKTKLALVGILVIYHFVCGQYLKKFEKMESARGHVFFRFFNEFPVILLFAIVILAILKPY